MLNPLSCKILEAGGVTEVDIDNVPLAHDQLVCHFACFVACVEKVIIN
jgi:hypothetical protein